MDVDPAPAARAISSRFVAARREWRPLADYPGEKPASLDSAYAIQADAIQLRGADVAGWKVGRIAPEAAHGAGADRLAGPIFADLVVEAVGPASSMPIIAGGFAAAEAEYLFQLGDLPSPLPAAWSIERTWEAVDAVRLGMEIAGSPFAGINDHGPAVTISDFGNNQGLLVGPALPARTWDALSDIDVALEVDELVVGHARAGKGEDGPIGAVRFLLELAAALGLPVRAGQWVSTGAVTGVHAVKAGETAVARFAETAVAARIVAGAARVDGQVRVR